MVIAQNPKLILLDEPTAGMGAEEVGRTVALLRTINATATLVVVEHDMQFIGALCRDVVVLSFGRKVAEGSPEAIRENPRVQEVYLGKPVSAAAEKEHGRAACGT